MTTPVYDRHGVTVHHGTVRTCPACGAALGRRDDERACDFKTRKYCNKRCMGRGQRAPLTEAAPEVETAEERRRRQRREAGRRTRARRRGEDVPPGSPGTPRGYRQTPEHVAKRVKIGADHPQWVGDGVSTRGGRTRALRAYPSVGPCTKCGEPKAERHHGDGNTANNRRDNIVILCRRCHMETDGRLDAVRRTPYRGMSYG